MRQNGRPSSYAVVVPQSLNAIERPKPPPELNDEERDVWFSIVEQEDADWFTAGSLPLLTQYCRHVVHAKRIAELIEHTINSSAVMPWVEEYDKLLGLQARESKLLYALASSMRLAQHSRRHDNIKKTVVQRAPHAITG